MSLTRGTVYVKNAENVVFFMIWAKNGIINIMKKRLLYRFISIMCLSILLITADCGVIVAANDQQEYTETISEEEFKRTFGWLYNGESEFADRIIKELPKYERKFSEIEEIVKKYSDIGMEIGSAFVKDAIEESNILYGRICEELKEMTGSQLYRDIKSTIDSGLSYSKEELSRITERINKLMAEYGRQKQ